MIAVRAGAVLDRLHPVLQLLAGAVSEAAARAGVGTVWITHGSDGKHGVGSLHKPENTPDGTVRALDFDIVNQPQLLPEGKTAAQVLDGIRGMVAFRFPDCDVILEDPGGPNEHLHAEYQPKM